MRAIFFCIFLGILIAFPIHFFQTGHLPIFEWSFLYHSPEPVPVVKKSFDEITLYLSGCPTLQNGLDGKQGNRGEATVTILRDGRTLEQICDTVGRGCSVCRVLHPSQ